MAVAPTDLSVSSSSRVGTCATPLVTSNAIATDDKIRTLKVAASNRFIAVPLNLEGVGSPDGLLTRLFRAALFRVDCLHGRHDAFRFGVRLVSQFPHVSPSLSYCAPNI